MRVFVLLPLIAITASASPIVRPIGAGEERAPTRIHANDNRQAAGTLANGMLTLRLELREAMLYPESDSGPGVPALAFAEVGQAPRVPAPLIRVRAGTELRVSIRNPLRDSTLTVYGLVDHAGAPDSGLRVPPGATREARFRVTTPGTYYYWGTTGGRAIDDRAWWESQLAGAFVVDAPGARTDDRIFVIGVWSDPGDSSAAGVRAFQDLMVINGKSWPYTERLTVAQGDTVRWRWINPSVDSHPMHLHGFFYHVETAGDAGRERTYAPDDEPFVVTQLMLPGQTMRMRWVAEREGNWIFHCHFAYHVSEHLLVGANAAPADHAGHDAAAMHRMAGLVLGLHINAAPRTTANKASVTRAREIRLLAQTKPRVWGPLAGVGYMVQDGDTPPAPDSIAIPGPLLLLKRGEPVRITVVNHLQEPTAVHWHGIELESFPDGVPNWSGTPGRVMPPIAPGDSFVAEFVPPRAGTYIYHTHANDHDQLGGGLYGPLIVYDPATPYDSSTNRIILAGGGGPSDSIPFFGFQSPGVVNGTVTPPPLLLRAGTTYRLRLININPDWRIIFSLTSDSDIARWRPVAKDGADLPPAQRRERPAWILTGPGETADVEFTPTAPGELRLEVKTQLSGWIVPIRVMVR